MKPEATKTTLKAFLQLTRFWNLVIIVIAQYFVALFIVRVESIFDSTLFLLSLSTALIAAAGYIINDYYDIKIDLINKPDRVVIGKTIARRYALLFHSTLSTIGVAIGLFISWKIALVNLLSVFLLWWYSNNLKRQPFIGNFVVALLTGISVMIVAIPFQAPITFILIYALFSFFMTLVREIIKDMEDLKGDNTFGCKTLPIIWGIRKTKNMIYFLLIIFSFLVIGLTAFYTQLPSYFFILFLFLPLGFFVMRLRRADTRQDFYMLSQWCKLIMLLGVVSIAFIS